MHVIDLILIICLFAGLNTYVAAVIYLSKCKHVAWGLVLPTMMAVVAGYQLAYGYLQSPSKREGILLFALIILAAFGYLLYVFTRYKK